MFRSLLPLSLPSCRASTIQLRLHLHRRLSPLSHFALLSSTKSPSSLFDITLNVLPIPIASFPSPSLLLPLPVCLVQKLERGAFDRRSSVKDGFEYNKFSSSSSRAQPTPSLYESLMDLAIVIDSVKRFWIRELAKTTESSLRFL